METVTQLKHIEDTEENKKHVKEQDESYPNEKFLQQQPQADTASHAFENILFAVGDYSFYQWKLMFITGFCGIFTAQHNMGAMFLAATPDHWCNIPYFEENNLEHDKGFLNVTVPWVHGKLGLLEPSKCYYYDYDYSSLWERYNSSSAGSVSLVNQSTIINQSNETFCQSWVYDDSHYKSTAVTQWNLVCDKRWMMSSIQASFMMGILTGAVLFSALSDKMGRRMSTLICCWLFILASVSAAFTTSFSLFLFLRFVVAASGQGMFLVNFILLMETVSLRGRNVMGNLFHVFFTIGFLLLCLFAYCFREWRHLQLMMSVPSVLLLSYYWLLPESPRWLLMHGREEEALTILSSVAKSNGREFPPDEELNPLLKIIAKEVKTKPHLGVTEKIKSVFHGAITLVRTPNMRRRNLIIFYAWFVTSMIYYGLAFSSASITSSPYSSVAFAALSEIPALMVIVFLFWFGRRPVMSASFLAAGIFCISVVFVPVDLTGWNLALTSLGKMCASNCFLLVFMFSAELVPTHVRNISIGIASMFARIGSGIAPYILDLLGDIYYAIPMITFGVLSLLAGLLSLLLPETGKGRLPESIEEIESMPR